MIALFALTSLFAVLSIGLAWAHVRKVERIAEVDAMALATSLKRMSQDKRRSELVRRTPAASWLHVMAEELASAESDKAQLAIANDALAEAGRALGERAEWPRAATRLAAFSALLLAIVAYVATRDESAALRIVSIGAVAAVLCMEAGRRAKSRSELERKNIDELVRVVLGPAGEGPPPRPRRRS